MSTPLTILHNYPWAGLVLVGILWGGTNPFIKRGSVGINDIQSSNFFIRTLLEIKFLFTRWKYLVPFLLNQCGSVVYFFTLQEADLSLAVPIANSLTFLFTALVGHWLGEEAANTETYIGMLLVLFGIFLCVLDKL